jgi:uncharacterized membrane protein
MFFDAHQRQEDSPRNTVGQHRPPLSRMVTATGLGACGGALVEYLFDPELGRTRRARIRDKGTHLAYRFRSGVGVLARDLANRGRGVVGTTRYRASRQKVDDRILHERVRAELGRYVSHPRAVEVHVAGGVVTLTGDVLKGESRRTCRALARIPGVKGIDTDWTVHRDAAGVPRMQGAGRPKRPVPELFQHRWSPTARFLTGFAAAVVWSLSGRLPRPLGYVLRAAGAVLAARAATNLPLKRLTGIATGRRAIDVDDSISVAAPPEDVWLLLSDYSVFARCMPDVLEVRRSADGRRSHWVIAGPAGVPIRFNAVETKREEGREIAWRTTEGQFIAHTGVLRLTQEGADWSRVQVRLTYNPVLGAVGHAMAALLGADPAHKLREDLMRLKSLIETGRLPVGAGGTDETGAW